MNHIFLHLARLILPLLLLPLLAACQRGDPAVDALHRTADNLMQSRPDSALLLLQACDSVGVSPVAAPVDAWPRRQRMRHELLRAKAMNKAYVNFTTDSVMKEVADYYDSHGTPNERMEAHYLLGCTYRDLGEAPRAIDCYLDAVNCADSTAADCDYWLMASVYGQMANLYHQQLLLSYEIEAHQKSYRYNLLAGDTLCALYEKKMEAYFYIMQNKKDSAELILNDVTLLYRMLGLEKNALRTSLILMSLYTDKLERQSDLKHLIDRFESERDFFDDNHTLLPSMRRFYFYKGKYYENRNNLDSAEICYRMIYRDNMTFVQKDPLYSGLLSVFQKRHNADSIAKYAQLYCMVNDSSIALKDREITAEITATHNYARYQRLAADNAEKANNRLITIIFLFLLASICIAVLSYFIHRSKTKQSSLRAEYVNIIDKYEQKVGQLKQLEKKHLQNIAVLKKELGKAESESKKASAIIEKLNIQYEQEKEKQMSEIEGLRNKTEELERSIKISGYHEHSTPFFQMGIVKRIRLFAKENDKQLSESDLNLMVETASEHFPDLITDLKSAPGISNLGIHLCILVILDLKPKEITHLLNISSSQVGNLKKNINKALFNEDTARTLYKNLSSRYKFFSI